MCLEYTPDPQPSLNHLFMKEIFSDFVVFVFSWGYFPGSLLEFSKKVRIPTSTPRKTNMTMEKQPFEDVSPIENGDFPLSS